MVFNMERGVYIDESIEFLKDNPSLQPFDLILANELDFGCARSGEKNTAEEVAKALGLSYVFGLEFIELKDARARLPRKRRVLALAHQVGGGVPPARAV